MPIQFFFIDTTVALTERKRLKSFIEQLFIDNKQKLLSLTVIFCTDNYLLDINKQFLNHNYFTDIITFNLTEDENTIEGDIYISADRIRDNATTHNVSIKSELHRVIFHGALHLCGFKDKGRTDKINMTAAENTCLQQYFS